jgi:hypothetical protein
MPTINHLPIDVFLLLLPYFLGSGSCSEWWQEEWVSAILEPEDAEEETVHEEHNTSPSQNSNLLCF